MNENEEIIKNYGEVLKIFPLESFNTNIDLFNKYKSSIEEFQNTMTKIRESYLKTIEPATLNLLNSANSYYNLNKDHLESIRIVMLKFQNIIGNLNVEHFLSEQDLENVNSDQEISFEQKIENDYNEKQIVGISNEIMVQVFSNPSKILEIKPRQFEELIADIFRKFQFYVELTKKTRDGGYDIKAVSEFIPGIKNIYLIECKQYAKENKVGVNVVRNLNGVIEKERANKGLIVTTSSFTQDAKNFVAELNFKIDLLTSINVVKWLNQLKGR